MGYDIFEVIIHKGFIRGRGAVKENHHDFCSVHIYSLMLFCRENQHSRTDDGAFTLGEGVVMKVSSDNSSWYDYDGTNRRRYMNTVEPQP